MKQLLPLLCWALVAIVAASVFAETGDGYVGIYSDSLGIQACASVPPNTAATLYVIAKTSGQSATGITGAEFRIEVTNPSGWLISYNSAYAPNVVLGNPIDTDPNPNAGGGVNVAFPSCQVPDGNGQVKLGTLSVFNESGSPTTLLVRRHSHPSNAGFACPLFVKCDDPYYTKVCMTASPPDSCTLTTQKADLTAVNDPVYFVAALNEVTPDPDPDPELPDSGPQLLAMFKAGAVSLPPGETQASLASTTIRSAQLAAVLTSHDVQVLARAFPSFDLADTLGTSRTGETVRFMNYSRIYRLILPTTGNAEALRTDLRPIPEVLFVHHDGGVGLNGACTFDSIPSCVTTVTNCPNDSLFAAQWALVNWEQTGGTCDADIDADEAWELATGSVTVKIGILDTGIVPQHEDVAGKVTGEFTVPPVYHGTFVACIGAANTDNFKGIAGVDHKARLVSKKNPYISYPELPSSMFQADSILAEKVREAAVEGLHVLNSSWFLADSLGHEGRFSHTVRGAFRDYYISNGVAVASMGNAGLRDSPVQYPAAFGQGIIAVGATDNTDAIADFSSRGRHIDVAAPGVQVLSCAPHNIILNRYVKLNGTSFSAPHVAGLAGLLFSARELYNDDVEQIIRLSAEDKLPAGFDSLYGMDRINARAALDHLLRLPNRLYNDQEVVGGTLQASDWQGEVTFLFPPPGVPEDRYYSFRHPVETTVTFPVTFQSPPHVWGRGVATIGYSTDGSDSGFDHVNYGMGWCETVGTVTASGCTLRTYVYSLRDSTGAHIAWAPTDAAHVKYAYSVLGELQASDAGGFTAVEAAGSWPSLTSMNPLRSGGRFRVWLPSSTGARLEIFDVSGRLVRLLHEGQMAAGTHDFPWDGKTTSGHQASSGLYFARLRAGDRVLNRKVVVLQ